MSLSLAWIILVASSATRITFRVLSCGLVAHFLMQFLRSTWDLIAGRMLAATRSCSSAEPMSLADK